MGEKGISLDVGMAGVWTPKGVETFVKGLDSNAEVVGPPVKSTVMMSSCLKEKRKVFGDCFLMDLFGRNCFDFKWKKSNQFAGVDLMEDFCPGVMKLAAEALALLAKVLNVGIIERMVDIEMGEEDLGDTVDVRLPHICTWYKTNLRFFSGLTKKLSERYRVAALKTFAMVKK